MHQTIFMLRKNDSTSPDLFGAKINEIKILIEYQTEKLNLTVLCTEENNNK